MDPNEIYSTVIECMDLCCKKLVSMGISSDKIKAIGIANQRGKNLILIDYLFKETCIVWDRKTGCPLYNAIVWLDTRTSELAREYIDRTPSKHEYFYLKI